MASPAFHAAASAALLEYQMRIASPEPNIAAAATYKLRGAQEFLGLLMTIGEPDPKPSQTVTGGLTPPEYVTLP